MVGENSDNPSSSYSVIFSLTQFVMQKGWLCVQHLKINPVFLQVTDSVQLGVATFVFLTEFHLSFFGNRV